MTFDFYTFSALERAGCAVFIMVLIWRRSSSKALQAWGFFLGAYALSIGIFFVRPYLPAEWAELLRDIGVGLQDLGIGLLAFLLWRRVRRNDDD